MGSGLCPFPLRTMTGREQRGGSRIMDGGVQTRFWSLGPSGPETPKKSEKCLPGPPAPGPPQESGKSLEKVFSGPFRDFFQTLETFSRFFSDFFGVSGSDRPRDPCKWPTGSQLSGSFLTRFGLFSGSFWTFWTPGTGAEGETLF